MGRKEKPKILVITMTECEGCQQLKKDMQGKCEVCDIMADDQCLAMAEKAEIEAVPTALKIEGNKITKCTIIKRGDKPIAVCGGEEYEL